MCLFSQPVEQVSKTRIFARLVADTSPRQILVYSMQFSAAGDLAMVLPLPTPAGSAEDSVRFINLEEYPTFFEDMAKGFPAPLSRSAAPKGTTLGAAEEAPLEVHDVGAFEASFVPKQADFGRLDERFRLPEGVWKKLPCPTDYGYAVFKLKAGKQQSVHPMAISFPTRSRAQVFFPTTHLHGEAYERRADFDHTLYFQGNDALRLPLPLDGGTGRFARLAGQMLGVGGGTSIPHESNGPAKDFMQTSEERGLIDPERKIYRFGLQGRLPNRDVCLWPKYHPSSGNYP